MDNTFSRLSHLSQRLAEHWPVPVRPKSYLAIPHPKRGPLALVLCEAVDDHARVTTVADAQWMLNHRLTDAEKETGIVVPPDNTVVDLQLSGWPQDWDRASSQVEIVSTMLALTERGTCFTDLVRMVDEVSARARLSAQN